MTDKKQQDKTQLNVNLDPTHTPIMYTDMIFITANEDGITFDICQKSGNQNQVQVVARIGMSREHGTKFAKRLSEVLALTITHSIPENKN